jgi:hypothetical protein
MLPYGRVDAEGAAVNLSPDDRTAIHQVLALHGHLSDRAEVDRFSEVFTDNVIYDVSGLGGGVLVGLAGLADGKQAAAAQSPRNPVAQHLTNVVLSPETADRVRSASKGLGIRADGSCISLTYYDLLLRTGNGWRIAHRTVMAPQTSPTTDPLCRCAGYAE